MTEIIIVALISTLKILIIPGSHRSQNQIDTFKRRKAQTGLKAAGLQGAAYGLAYGL